MSYHQTCRQRIILIISAFGRDFEELFNEVRVRRGADVASDHHLLVARLKLKLRRNWTERTNQYLGYNTFF